MRNKKITVILLLTLLSLLVGCTNSEFNSNYKQFKESYILATDFIEIGNDPLKAIKKIDTNIVETELEKMKGFMDKMNDVSESKYEKGIYDNVNSYYQGVLFLLYAEKNFDKLSIDEKRKVYIEAEFASMNRKSIKGGEE